ncbi:DUF3408 domain-containing protein [Niabella sp. W65]|nr:DUF3408 domain-containing protein [Niabella sp. W65]MCH7363737.1 DUF3408 domain-containing protein [Niabella sp. W65]
MDTDNIKKGFEKPNVDEDYLMNIMSGDEPVPVTKASKDQAEHKEPKAREKTKPGSSKKMDYEDVFLTNRYPSGRNGKVVYIRPEFHERLLRIVQLAREDKTTLYSYIDNILEYHFREFGNEITDYFNDRYKPIL